MLGVEATLLHLLFLLLPTLPVKGWRPTILPNLATCGFGDNFSGCGTLSLGGPHLFSILGDKKAIVHQEVLIF